MTEEEDFIRRFKALPNNAGKRRAITTLNLFLDMLEEHLDSQTPTRRESFERTTCSNTAPVAEVKRTSHQEQTTQPTTQLKTELPKRAPFPSPSARAAYRDKIVREIWSTTLRSEFVDRIVAIKESGVPACDITSAIGYAKQEEAASGKPLWKTLGSWCKQQYVQNGVEWTKCLPEIEPKPEPLKPVAEIMYSDLDGKNVVFHTRAISPEQAQQISDELYDGRYTLQDVKDRIARYCA